MDCFALLDDRDATCERPLSRLYTGLAREHVCTDSAALEATWTRIEADQAKGLHAVLLADYEWGAKLLKAGHEHLPPGDAAALRVLMFRELAFLGDDEVSDWLLRQEARDAAQGVLPDDACGTMNLTPSVSRESFTQAIASIHAAIAAGETYQVNYTYRLHGQVYGSPVALYRALRARQPVHYGALVVMPADGRAVEVVLSRSPELFLRHDAGLLTARPMKGTAARHSPAEGDSETARLLAEDIKNRAENLMIVDLLRNDLGRVARTGSVKVPSLFTIEPYATLFQMTSTVQACLQPEIGLPGLLRAVFPCGSITGAPKHHTMLLISQLESTPRGLYCGAIGWVDAPKGGARCGDFCLSVAIRTLSLGPEARGLRPLALGIGAGIVQDSRADDEFDECLLKARFLTGIAPGFELFETMLVMPGGGIRHLDRHLGRLGGSAGVLGFAFDRAAALAALRDCCGTLVPGVAYRLRLALAHDGRLRLSHAPLQQWPEEAVELLIAPDRLPRAHPLSAHKTTLRRAYDEGVKMAEQRGAFDSLFFSAEGHLVEGGRSTVFVRLGGRWWTPPIEDGALPGVMRSVVLDDPTWRAAERRLTRDDLLRAEGLMVCNALRGTLPARLASVVPAAALA